MKQAALWSRVCAVMEDPPPTLAGYPPGWLTPLAWHENVMDGGGAQPLCCLSILV